MTGQTNTKYWLGFTLREALVTGFSAVGIILAQQFLRIPMHLPGHRLLPLVFFLLLARACIRACWVATLTGFLAGLMSLLFGMGHAGPMQLLSFVIAGLIADIVFRLLPRLTRSVALSAITGAFMGVSWVLVSIVQDRLLGLDFSLAVTHSLLRAGGAMIFGALGGAFATPVARRMQASGTIMPDVPSPEVAADSPEDRTSVQP
ncbi:MAG: hypothetical protein P4M01_11735 [Acidobacteriota bacterium]|nr:hypothetical protein [Acidobacteriota bacterium]